MLKITSKFVAASLIFTLLLPLFSSSLVYAENEFERVSENIYVEIDVENIRIDNSIEVEDDINIENLVAVRENGAEILHNYPRSLMII